MFCNLCFTDHLRIQTCDYTIPCPDCGSIRMQDITKNDRWKAEPDRYSCADCGEINKVDKKTEVWVEYQYRD